MNNSSSIRHDAHSVSASHGNWSTRRIATAALFTAIAIVASYLEFPIFPLAPFLKYDPSGIICLIAGFAFGPATGALVSILMWIPHLFSNPLGALMGAIACTTLTVPAAMIYQKHTSKTGVFMAMLIAGIICLAASIGANLIVTPIYTGAPRQAIVDMILPILLPFNVMKIIINCVVCALTYKNISKIIAR